VGGDGVGRVSSVALCVIALFKGKLILGLAGSAMPTLSLVAVCRLAKLVSSWDRRLYGERKLEQARARTERYSARRLALRDRLYGG
jgi:hypothetical protein